MCRFERYTASRGRWGLPETFFRTRPCRRSRATRFASTRMLRGSLRGLARLLPDVLPLVPDAFALVRLGLAGLPDVRRDLPDQLLLVALGHALDHVRDQGSGQAVQGAVVALVAGPLHPNRAVHEQDPHVGMEALLELATRALHGHARAVHRDVDPGGHGNGLFSDPGHGCFDPLLGTPTRRGRGPRPRSPASWPDGR